MDAQGAAPVAMIGLKEVVASLFLRSEITRRPSNDAGVENGAASGHLIPERPFKGGASCQDRQGH